MSNNSSLNVRKVVPSDPRAARSTYALGAALVELMLEEKFENITVQSILDCADVGRSTFYAHFRNKHDVLHTSYERMFGFLEQEMNASSRAGVRIAPCRWSSGVGNSGRQLLPPKWMRCSTHWRGHGCSVHLTNQSDFDTSTVSGS